MFSPKVLLEEYRILLFLGVALNNGSRPKGDDLWKKSLLQVFALIVVLVVGCILKPAMALSLVLST
jgi:hypothetical protein